MPAVRADANNHAKEEERGSMKRCFNAVIAATLAASLAVPVPAAFADEAGDDTASGAAQAAATAYPGRAKR